MALQDHSEGGPPDEHPPSPEGPQAPHGQSHAEARRPRPYRTGGRTGRLARTALKTLQELRAAGSDGTTIDALSASVGYQPATIARHIDSLAAHHLVHQRDGRWYAVAAS
ncbi:helix-turn-helix transcriptional regulator [Streptomyces sp. PA03-6a]|nr:helix-turn-helix transcriptional regulator [Streptomyces sp. PA03-6a]